MLTLITSMNERLFVDYGKRFLESWIKHAGLNVRLVVCAEGKISDIAPLIDGKKIIACSLESRAQKSFQDRYRHFFQASGLVPVRVSLEEKIYKFQYNYRFDAIRFSFKAFSYHRVLNELALGTEFVGWIDSDVVCLTDFDLSKLVEVLPGSNQIASYLGRTAFPQPVPYSECGFVAFNYRREAARDFINDFISAYESGEIFLNPEWHDCVAFDVLRNRYESDGHEFRNLSGEFSGEEHPFVKCVLGNYFDHLKGPQRKIRGRS